MRKQKGREERKRKRRARDGANQNERKRINEGERYGTKHKRKEIDVCSVIL